MQSNYQNSINAALKELATTRSISSGLLVCNALLEHMGIETKTVEDIELSKLKLPNAERYDRWFDAHPHFRGDRACFDLAQKGDLLEAKFYALQKRSKLFIAGSVTFTPNFEDREYTRTDPSMKVGIDFFLTPEKDAVIVVLSNKGSLRLVELSGRLTNTQHEIFTVWHNVAKLADKNALHTTIWESFKLSSLNKKFYEGIANSFTTLTQHLQKDGVDEQLSNQFASRLHGRLLFLWFLRKKHIINEAKEYFTLEDQGDTKYYAYTLSTLFFNVLNNEDHKDVDPVTPYLNGGLFDQDADGKYWNTHKPSFPTGFFKTLYDHFDSFNFTTDESTPEYEQIAIDPEMLGRIFESFLATLKTETGAQAKKANGAFYTPREIVSYMSRESLRQYLYTALDASAGLKNSIDELLDRPDSEWALAGTNSKRDTVAKEDRERIVEALRNIRVLDPAVGSGAFPMGVLHKILSIFERLDPNFDSYETKLSILRNNIYGVDIDPTAIEIARLRAWLSIIVDVEELKKIKPLPNLDFKFVCANSLVGLTRSAASFTTDDTLKPTLMRIRDEYYATSSKVKKEKLQKEYLKLTHKESLFDSEETKQLKSYRPFEVGSSTSFYDPELMHGVSVFDLIIGNPPYNVKLSDLDKLTYKNKYTSVSSGRQDTAAIFVQAASGFAKNDFTISFIVPYRLFSRKRNHGAFQEYILEHLSIDEIIYLGKDAGFESAKDEFMVVLLKKPDRENLVKICNKPDFRNLNQLNFVSVKQSVFRENGEININLLKYDVGILKKLESSSTPLSSLCEVKDGIVPYIREKMISSQKLDSRYVKFAGVSGCYKLEPYYFHADEMYLCYDISEAKKYITDREELRKVQLRDKSIYLQEEKIITSQNSSRLKGTIDREQYFVSNSIHSTYLKEGYKDTLALEFILGCINSSALNYFYNSKRLKGVDLHPQILISTLKTVPVPKLDTPEKAELGSRIVRLVRQIIESKRGGKSNSNVLEEEVDDLVSELFGLNEDEVRIIKENK